MTIDTPFEVRVEPSAPTAVLGLVGRVDRSAEDPLMAAFATAMEVRPTRVVLDLAATTYINSSGLASLVALLTEARAHDVVLAARGLDAHYRHLFDITRLSDLIEVEPADRQAQPTGGTPA